jgi:methionyl-tRNA formyltransferase
LIDLEDRPVGDIWAGGMPAVAHVLCSQDHPVNAWMERWVGVHPDARLKRTIDELTGGDFLFLISCGEIIKPEVRDRYRHTLVIHAGDLPKDRGWSPHIWSIIEGSSLMTVSMLSCADPVDSGDIWHQERISLNGTETYDEINRFLFDAELRLMDWALRFCDSSQPRMQKGEPTYRRKRTPADSRIDPRQSIAEVFDLLRVCDPDRYPAFFEHRGERYAVSLHKLDQARTNTQ